MSDLHAELLDLDGRIAERESAADVDFFDLILHQWFVMQRPTGRLDRREDLIAGLATGATRLVEDHQVVFHGRARAVATCVVTKWEGGGQAPPPDAARFHNLRTWIYDPDHGWQLLSWLNEPAN